MPFLPPEYPTTATVPHQAHPVSPEPERKAVASKPVLTPTEQMNQLLLVENLQLTRAKNRFELATIAAIMAVCPALNFLHSTVDKLEPEDWLGFRDIAETLHRQARELADKLAPLCRVKPAKPAEPPHLSIVS